MLDRLNAIVNSDFARVTYTEAMDLLAKSGKKLPPIYLSCGTADGLYADNTAYRAHLEKLGYTVTWDEDGSGHEWGFWNRQVGKFIEELVK